jgi:DNA-binding CsgD family transcriptional regulator/tetratricopeptide (TPR) repeat protein
MPRSGGGISSTGPLARAVSPAAGRAPTGTVAETPADGSPEAFPLSGPAMSAREAMMVSVPLDTAPPRPMVGRTRELAELRRLVGLVPSTSGAAAVVIGGDAGVGKSRLLTELRESATAAGHRVLLGHCLDFGDSALPYLPFTEMFGRLATEAPALAESVASAHPAIRRLMPGMRRLSVGDADAAPRVERGELFEAVHAALDRLAASAPLLVVVEDLHWADHSTREMLSFLFSRTFSEPVSIVASYRSDDLHRRHPLRGSIAEWFRLPGVTRLPLEPLDDADVRALVQTLHPTPMPELQLHAMVARAEGNAFFVEELVAAAEHSRCALPEDLADLLLVRLDALEDDSRLVVRAASVAGRRVSHTLLARVVDLGAGALERALRAAVERNVLVPVGSDGYAFRHALLAEAVYDDLLPGERVRLHSRYSQVLRSGEVDSTAAEVARHALAAHDDATAVRASIRAGAEAMSVGGPDEAADHYQAALELVADPGVVRWDGDVDVVELTTRASEAMTAAGHPYRSVDLVRDQLAQLGPDAEPLDRARLLVALAAAAVLTDNDVDVLALTTQAMGLVAPEPPSPLRAELLSLQAHASAQRRRDDDAARWAREAIAMARDLDLPAIVAAATTTLSRLAERSLDPEASRAVLTDIIGQAKQAGDVMGELRGLHNLGYSYHEDGLLDQAQTVFTEAWERAVAAGRPWAPYGLDARVLASITAYMRGDWALASQIADVRGESPPGMAEAELTAADMLVAAGRGDRSALGELPAIRAWWHRDGLIAIVAGSAAIDLYGDAGDLPAAQAIHDEVVSLVTSLWGEDVFAARLRLSGLLLGQLATSAVRSGATDWPGLSKRAEELTAVSTATLEASRRRNVVTGPEGLAWAARVDAERVRLAWLTGDGAPSEDELVAVWQRAVAAFERYGQVFEVARSQTRLAAVLRAVGQGELARPLVQQARATALQLGAEPLLSELRTTGASASRATGVSRRDEALTPREHEILTLVAEGRTNADIARQLFISSKTVSVHVSNILAKLGATGRTEAAALARRRGLLDD